MNTSSGCFQISTALRFYVYVCICACRGLRGSEEVIRSPVVKLELSVSHHVAAGNLGPLQGQQVILTTAEPSPQPLECFDNF